MGLFYHQIEDNNIYRRHLNVSDTDDSVICKITEIADSGIKINSSTGQTGTGIVGLALDFTLLDNRYDAKIATAISNLVDSSPSTLDTLNELASALGDDPNFATTITNLIGTKLSDSDARIANWTAAYGWGNHALAGYVTGTPWTAVGYLTGITKAQIEAQLTGAITSHSHAYLSDSDARIANWTAAYGWGNHALAGYVTGTPWTAVGYLTGITKAQIEAQLTGAITSHTHSYLSDSDARIANWTAAHNYSQVGHLPLSGGTLTGSLISNPTAATENQIVLYRNAALNSQFGKIGVDDGGFNFRSSIAGYAGVFSFRGSSDGINFTEYLNIGNGILSIPSTTASTSTSTGALVVAGGLGVGGSGFFGSKVNAGTSYGMAGVDDAMTWTTNTLRLGQGSYWENLQLWANGSPRITIANTGNVAFSTSITSPTLTLNGGTSTNLTLASSTTNMMLFKAASSSYQSGFYFDWGTTRKWEVVCGSSSADLSFYSYNTNSEVFKILHTNGFVGIGSTNPLYRAVISNSGAEGLELGPGYSAQRILIQGYNRSGGGYCGMDFAGSDFAFGGNLSSTGSGAFAGITSNGNITTTGNFYFPSIDIGGTPVQSVLVGNNTGSVMYALSFSRSAHGGSSFLIRPDLSGLALSTYGYMLCLGREPFRTDLIIGDKSATNPYIRFVGFGAGVLMSNTTGEMSSVNAFSYSSGFFGLGYTSDPVGGLKFGVYGNSYLSGDVSVGSQLNANVISSVTSVSANTTIDAGGDITSQGDVYSRGVMLTSDMELKKNIGSIENLSKFKNISAKQFNWKDDKKEKPHPHYSPMAQEVEEIAPELVKVNKNGDKSINMVELLWAKISQMEEEIRSLKSRPSN